MNVAELIEKLQEMDPGKKVLVWVPGNYIALYDVFTVDKEALRAEGEIFIEGLTAGRSQHGVERLSSDELVELYNNAVFNHGLDEEPVESFPSHAEGVERNLALARRHRLAFLDDEGGAVLITPWSAEEYGDGGPGEEAVT